MLDLPKSHRYNLYFATNHRRLEVTFLQLWDAGTFLLLVKINFKCNIVWVVYVNQSEICVNKRNLRVDHSYLLALKYFAQTIILSYQKHCLDTEQVSAQILANFHQK